MDFPDELFLHISQRYACTGILLPGKHIRISLSLAFDIYIYIYINVFCYIYIYIYICVCIEIKREGEREREMYMLYRVHYFMVPCRGIGQATRHHHGLLGTRVSPPDFCFAPYVFLSRALSLTFTMQLGRRVGQVQAQDLCPSGGAPKLDLAPKS